MRWEVIARVVVKVTMAASLIAISLLILTLISGYVGANEIIRDPEQPRVFMHTHLCPTTEKLSYPCPGYVVDHIKPLKCGGKDAPENMQLQTIAEGKRKDRWEIRGDQNHAPCSGLPK